MQSPNEDQTQNPKSETLDDSLSDDIIEILDSPVKKSAPAKPAPKTRRSPSKPEMQMAPVFSQMAAPANTTQTGIYLKRKRSSVTEPISKDSDREDKHKESRWQRGGQASGSNSTRVDPLKAVQP